MANIQVGVLFSQQGFSASYGTSQLRGTLLAICEINEAGGVAGRPIEPIIHDPQSEPERYSQLANKLLMDDGVSVIFGCTSSFSRKAVCPWVEKRNALLFYPTCYEGFDFSPNVIFTGPSPNQLHVELAGYLKGQGRRRLYLLGSDYIFPHESNRIMKDLFAETEIEIVGERYLPLSCSSEYMSSVLDDVSFKRPDMVLSTLVGPATPLFYDACWDRAIRTDDLLIASLTTSELEVSLMRHTPFPGHVTASPYFSSLDTPANKEFRARFVGRYGNAVPIDACAEAAYFQVHLFAKAAAANVDHMDTEGLREALANIEYLAPQGTIRVDPENNHTYLWPRIGITSENGQFQVIRSARAPVKPDPYLVNYVGVLTAA